MKKHKEYLKVTTFPNWHLWIDTIKDHDYKIIQKNIDAKGDVELLIEQLGRKRNFLRKGGVVDEDSTSRCVIREWQEGRIKIN